MHLLSDVCQTGSPMCRNSRKISRLRILTYLSNEIRKQTKTICVVIETILEYAKQMHEQLHGLFLLRLLARHDGRVLNLPVSVFSKVTLIKVYFLEYFGIFFILYR